MEVRPSSRKRKNNT
jgi:hypothetical protein